MKREYRLMNGSEVVARLEAFEWPAPKFIVHEDRCYDRAGTNDHLAIYFAGAKIDPDLPDNEE